MMNVPANMAVSIRGRPTRSVRMRGRNDSGEENVPLDLTREPSDNLREILQNIAKSHGVSNMRKLGHLNNFVKLLNSVSHCEEKLGFTYEEIIICLRVALLNEVKEVRAAGLRALRYLIHDSSVLQTLLQLQVDYLISRWEDREARFLASKMAIIAAFRSWSGIINLCKSGNSGVQSLIGLLCIPNMEVRANTILPHSHSHHLHCLPTLINMAASFDISQEKRLRASAAVNHLKRFHEKKRCGPKPYSLYLDHILRRTSNSTHKREQHQRLQKDIYIMKDTEEALMMNLRDSQILSHKQNLDWNWILIITILKWPNVNLRNNKDEQMHKFVRRLLYFYKPSSKLYSALELDHAKARQLTVAGCQFNQFLLDSEDDGQAYLEELVKDTVQWLTSSSGLKSERSLHSNGLLSTLSQHYFLFLGTLSAKPAGVKMLEKCGVFQCLLSLCSMKNQDHLLKLTVSTLDYSRDGLARVILSKILTAATDNCRLYATKHLRVLLRANVEFFSNWGMELLVTQLHDHNKTVSMEALDILDEACEEKANLHALIHMKPALSHLGEKGLLLLLRFLSIPKGFSYLNERGYVNKQLDKWQKEYNLKYVDMIEEQMNEALTTYRKPVDGDNYVRRSNQRLQRPNVFLPVHLYGQLVHDKTGCLLLEAQGVIPDLSYTVRSPVLDKWEGIKQLKAALWALGNIGSSNWGLNLLQEENVIPDIIALAQHCEVLSIRGTCVYVLGVISRTRQGSDVLKALGWDSVRHSRRQQWPVVPDEVDAPLPSELSSVPSTLSLNSESTSSRHNSESESQPSLYFMDDDREGLDMYEASSLGIHTKTLKDRSPFTILTPSHLRNRFLNSLSLPSKKGRSPSDTKGTTNAAKSPEELRLMRRNRTITEPSNYSPGHSGQSEVFYNGNRMPHSPTVSLETSFVGIKALAEPYGTEGCSDLEGRGQHKAVTPGDGQRERSSREHLTCDGASVMPGGGTLKSRSHSFNTDTTTSGISSMSSSPSREPAASIAMDTDCASLNTVVSTKTVKMQHSLSPQSNHNHILLSKSNSTSLVLPGSAHTLPRRAHSLKSPSVATIKSLVDCSYIYTSPRDALGYATLKRLQQQRIHPSLSHSEALASPAKDVLFTDTITMKTRSLDSRLTPQPCRGPPLKPQMSITELLNSSRSEQQHLLGADESTGLQEHTEQNCLYCCAITVLGSHTHSHLNNTHTRTDLSDGFSQWHSQSSHNHLEVVAQSKFSGISGCSDAAVSQGSASSTPSTELILGGKAISEDGPACKVLLRKEVLRLVINLSSSVGTKGHETGLLTIKEKFPFTFDDICLYSEVSFLLANCMFRLASRRFIQELFQDVQFIPVRRLS
ncbi:rapamycin-insensitive companion of mTOR-like [Sinocyclocheilus grahami]|uniref:rapamycin-insensitive companion of mTOR-like n=1 Tax=Sinocyclocheilus grahami TaxID=75366 RepID=UPI0007AC6A0F|nr:PREDICTED: rapamycin-insensitive companion of mTOR-like [Sinocyclocheilus grahami]